MIFSSDLKVYTEKTERFVEQYTGSDSKTKDEHRNPNAYLPSSFFYRDQELCYARQEEGEDRNRDQKLIVCKTSASIDII
jgi:hypothetical protein